MRKDVRAPTCPPRALALRRRESTARHPTLPPASVTGSRLGRNGVSVTPPGPRRERAGTGTHRPPSPRSVVFRLEIGPFPHRDRSSSGSRSVPSTRSPKNLFSHTRPVMDYGPLSSPRPIAARPQNRMSVRMTLELLGAVPLDDRPCNDAAPHRCSESPGGQCHSGGHPPAPEPAIETADSGATRMTGRLREPISTRKRTDLGGRGSMAPPDPGPGTPPTTPAPSGEQIPTPPRREAGARTGT